MRVRRQPYGVVERDLVRLVGERVNKAAMSVLHLAENSEQAFMIATAAEAEVAAILAGAYCAMTNTPVGSVKPVEVAIAVLERVREVGAGEPGE